MSNTLIIAGVLAVALTGVTVTFTSACQKYQYNLQGEALTRSVTCRGEFGHKRKCSRAALREFEAEVKRHSL